MDRRQAIGLSAAFSLMGRFAMAGPAEPFRIGAIADAQYADEDDAPPRLYRRTPAKLAEAVATLNRQNIDFAVHLGDFIDRNAKSYATLLPVVRKLVCPVHFVLGNHDFGVPEEEKLALPAMLGMPARYYSFAHKGWVFVVLDGNDLSTYGWPQGSPQDRLSRQIHEQRYRDHPTWDGGIGEGQLAWLDQILTAADSAGQKVALFCHFPVFPENPHNLWNAPEVLARIIPHRSVKLWLNGHNHDGNYGEIEGLHCLNLKGMLNTDNTAYAVLEFHPAQIAVHGYGRQEDMILALR